MKSFPHFAPSSDQGPESLKLINRCSQDLHSRYGFDSSRGEDDSQIFHTQPWPRRAIILLPSIILCP